MKMTQMGIGNTGEINTQEAWIENEFKLIVVTEVNIFNVKLIAVILY